MDKKEQKIVNDTITEFLAVLDVKATFECEYKEDVVDVVLQTEETGIIIGYHGEILDSMQLILSAAVSQKIGRFVRVVVEVGDYKKNRSEYVEQKALSAKERAVLENREISLPNLKPWERRVVHMLLQDDEEVVTESIGEGKERTLVIKPR